MKKFLSVILAVMLLVSALSFTAFADLLYPPQEEFDSGTPDSPDTSLVSPVIGEGVETPSSLRMNMTIWCAAAIAVSLAALVSVVIVIKKKEN